MTDDVLNQDWRAKKFEAALRPADIDPGGRVEEPSLEERKEERKVEREARHQAFQFGLHVCRREGLIVLVDRSQRELGVYRSWAEAAQAIADYARRRAAARKSPAS